jgi:hypothetical protein
LNTDHQEENGRKDIGGKRPVTISAQKLSANRRNAAKSTGPKTVKGKQLTRRNALKHGLFADLYRNLEFLGEDPKEFHKLFEGLRQQYQPFGTAEELLVQRATRCLWRLLRAERYETAQLTSAVAASVMDDYKSDKVMIGVFEDLKQLLGRAEDEIVTTGALSQELQEKMFAVVTFPPFREEWCFLEERVKEGVREKKEGITLAYGKKLARSFSVSLLEVRKRLSTGPDSEPPLSSVTALATTRLAIGWLEVENRTLVAPDRANHFSSLAVPNTEVMDKVLRCESAAERSFWRTLDMLERLQRHRMGEPVLPSVRVRLTQ